MGGGGHDLLGGLAPAAAPASTIGGSSSSMMGDLLSLGPETVTNPAYPAASVAASTIVAATMARGEGGGGRLKGLAAVYETALQNKGTVFEEDGLCIQAQVAVQVCLFWHYNRSLLAL